MYCEKYLNDMNSRRSTKETIADIDHTLFTFETKILNKINSNCHFTNTIRMRKRSSSDPKVNLNEENLFDFIENENDLFQKQGPNINFKVFRSSSKKLTEYEKVNFKMKLQVNLKTEVSI